MMIASRSSSSTTAAGSEAAARASSMLSSWGVAAVLKLTFALNSSSWCSRLIARRPVEVRRSVRVEFCTGTGIEKNRRAAVRIISFESPTETMALASTRTLMGRGWPLRSTSAVWSAMSRSMLIALLGMVAPVVKSGISFDLPGPL